MGMAHKSRRCAPAWDGRTPQSLEHPPDTLLKGMSNTHKQPDGRDIAAQNDLQVCLGLAKFGWLTTRQIVGLVWPDTAQGQRSAQKRLRSLQERKLVLTARLDNGTPVHKLSQQGASLLHAFGHHEIPQRGTRDAKTGNYFHRALANNYLIFGIDSVANYWPEYQVLRGRAPMNNFTFEGYKLVPDAMLETADRETYWVEAENAAKSPAKLRRLARLARYLLRDTDGYSCKYKGCEYSILGMLFICPSLATVRAVAKAFNDYSEDDWASARTFIIYAPMTMSLVWPEAPRVATTFDVARELGHIQSEKVFMEDPNGWNWLHSKAP